MAAKLTFLILFKAIILIRERTHDRYGSEDTSTLCSSIESLYNCELVWNVKDIGLTEGDYQIEFVTHDGNQKTWHQMYESSAYIHDQPARIMTKQTATLMADICAYNTRKLFLNKKS